MFGSLLAEGPWVDTPYLSAVSHAFAEFDGTHPELQVLNFAVIKQTKLFPFLHLLLTWRTGLTIHSGLRVAAGLVKSYVCFNSWGGGPVCARWVSNGSLMSALESGRGTDRPVGVSAPPLSATEITVPVDAHPASEDPSDQGPGPPRKLSPTALRRKKGLPAEEFLSGLVVQGQRLLPSGKPTVIQTQVICGFVAFTSTKHQYFFCLK